MRQMRQSEVRHRPKLEWSPPPATPPPRPRHAPSSRASPSFAQCQILYCSAIVIFYDTITQRVEITSAAKVIGLLHGTDQSTHKANNAIAFNQTKSSRPVNRFSGPQFSYHTLPRDAIHSADHSSFSVMQLARRRHPNRGVESSGINFFRSIPPFISEMIQDTAIVTTESSSSSSRSRRGP